MCIVPKYAFVSLCVFVALGACSGEPTGGGSSDVGGNTNAGSTSVGGIFGTGGKSSTSGGAIATGGSKAGGTIATGGMLGTGGSSAACPQSSPTNATSCGSTSLTCLYEDCPNTGRTLATCANGNWSVQTGTSCAVMCSSSFTSLTCSSGQACVIRSGGAILPSCVNNTCGAGLVKPECVGADGCYLSASLNAGATFTCPVSCPPGSGGCA